MYDASGYRLQKLPKPLDAQKNLKPGFSGVQVLQGRVPY